MKKILVGLVLGLSLAAVFSVHAIRVTNTDPNNAGNRWGEEIDSKTGMRKTAEFFMPFDNVSVSDTAVTRGLDGYYDVSVTPGVNSATLPYRFGYRVTITNNGNVGINFACLSNTVLTNSSWTPLAVSATSAIYTLDNNGRVFYDNPNGGAGNIRIETRCLNQ